MQLNPIIVLAFLIFYLSFLLSCPTYRRGNPGFPTFTEGLSLPTGIGGLAAIALICSFIFLFVFLKVVPAFDRTHFSSLWAQDPLAALLGHLGGWILLSSLFIFSFSSLFFLLFGYEEFKKRYLEKSLHSEETKTYPVLGKIKRIFTQCQKKVNLVVPTKFFVLGKNNKDPKDFSGCAITGKGRKEIALLLEEDFVNAFAKGVFKEKEVRAALCHEIAHILQGDHLLPLLAMKLNRGRLIPLLTWGIAAGVALFAMAIQRLVDVSFLLYVVPIVLFFFFIRYLCFVAIARGMQDREYMADRQALLHFGIAQADLSSMIKKMALLHSGGIGVSSSFFLYGRGPQSKRKEDNGEGRRASIVLQKGSLLLKQVLATQVASHPPLKRRLAMLRRGTRGEKEGEDSPYVVRNNKDILIDGILWPNTLNAIIVSGYWITTILSSYAVDMTPYERAIYSLFWLNVGVNAVGEIHLVGSLDVQVMRDRFLRNWSTLLVGLEWRGIHLNNFMRVLTTSCFVGVLGLRNWLQTLLAFFLFATITSVSFALLAYLFNLMKRSLKGKRNHG